jgi:hypothetical protein
MFDYFDYPFSLFGCPLIPEPTFPPVYPPDGKYRPGRSRRSKNGKLMDWKRRKQIRERHSLSR